MFSAYTTLFRTPGGMKFSIAGFIGRMPISMEGLALIFVVVAASDSYALAGLLSAIAEITKTVATPFWSRQADRYGQSFPEPVGGRAPAGRALRRRRRRGHEPHGREVARGG